MKRATIADVAARAGVSRSTVSYALTVGVVEAVQKRGRKIPADFGIICQEHSIIANLASFSPMIIDVNAAEMATQAAHMIIDLLEDKEINAPQILIPPKLILGNIERDHMPMVRKR